MPAMAQQAEGGPATALPDMAARTGNQTLQVRGFRASDARPMPELPAVAGQVAQYSNTKALGVLMYTKYLYPLEIAAVILLIAMIAAIALTLREKRKDNKAIDPSLAVRVHARDRVQLVKLAPTQAPVAAPAPAAAPAEEVKK